jgi:hypothetical protein
LKVFTFTVLILLLSEIPIQAATYYVAKTGSNTNTCAQAQSESTPKLTINAGLACLAGGDTLYVRTGSYAEHLQNVIPPGTAASPTTVAAYPGETVSITPQTAGDQTIVITGPSEGFGGSGQYITIDGFILDGQSIGSNAVKTYGQPPHITLKNLEIKYYLSHLILGGGDYFTVQNINAHHWGQIDDYAPGYNATYLMGNNMLIENSQWHDTLNGSGTAIWRADGAQPSYTGIIIRGNTVWNIHRHGTGIAADRHDGGAMGCAYNGGPVTCTIYNNVVYDADSGISASYNSLNTSIYNNTIVNIAGGYYSYCVDVHSGSAQGIVVKNNICWQASSGTVNVEPGATVVLSNNLSSNPTFQDANNHDYRLQPTSPAIDAGVILSAVPKDALGVDRPQGASYDIGAYEYAGGSVVAISAPTNLRVTSAQ